MALCMFYYKTSWAYLMNADSTIKPFFCIAIAGDSCNIPKNRPRPMIDTDTNIFESRDFQYFSPSVNPNNSQEFVCIKKKGSSTSIIIYNLKTNEERIISTFSSNSRGKVD